VTEHRLAAITVCLDLGGRYAHALDARLPESWLDCFTTDGVFESVFPEGRTNRHEGAESLRAFVTRLGRPRERMHVSYPPAILTAMQAEIRAVTPWSTIAPTSSGALEAYGRYEDHIVLEEDGSWRFRTRRATVIWTVPGFETPKE
jgi:hypothetical protein